ncbi:MAG: DUF5056 domain-containing protein [Prevotella sp.]|nr:DUF5056 domain-containing protein [Prevotella sp.]
MTENNTYHNDPLVQPSSEGGGGGCTSDDDLLLEQFFQAARAEQVPDNGFTHRVMTRLPEHQLLLSRLWTAACIIVGLVVFTLIGGWNIIVAGIIGVLTTMPTTSSQLLHLMLCGIVLTALAAAGLIRSERLTLGY